MKYYRIIYNSSQRTQSGSAGFGVRTYTEGTPQEYIDMLKDNDFFIYSSGNLSQPSPNALLEDGKIILRYPATYSFAKLPVPNMGKEVYVVSRTICVGFDYPYYVKFAAARLGNFVVDAYIFEEMPSAEVFEMLYEQPALGSAGFVPRNPVPSPDNEEMKTLSLDKMDLLAPEEKHFTCQQMGPISDKAFDLLFSYIESERLRQPLMVKCPSNQAASLMADLMRLLPQKLQETTFFCTNYQTGGLKEGYKVFFINETNPYDYENTGQFFIFDVNQTVKTIESELYRDELVTLYNNGDNQGFEKLLNWMRSPQYASIRDKSAKTKQVLFNYINTIDPKKFNFQQVFDGDNELLMTLKDYFAKDKSNQTIFNGVLSWYLEHEEMRGGKMVAMVLFCNKLIDKGFDINSVIEKSQEIVTAKLVETPEMFKLTLDKIGLEGLRKYLDKRVLVQHEQLLDDKRLFDDWDKIYKDFYPENKQNDHVGIISRMFTLPLPQDVIDRVVKGFGVNDLELCRYYTEVAKRDNLLVNLSWKRTWDIMQQRFQKRLELPDEKLAANIDKYLVTPLMKDENRQNGLTDCKNLVDLLQGNFTDDNFDTLFDLAVKHDTRQTSTKLYEKGMSRLKGKQVGPFMKSILKNVQPETGSLVIRMEQHKLKLELLTSFFKEYSDPKECKKAIDRMRKDKTLQISDDEYNSLLYNLGLMGDKKKKSKSNDLKGPNDNDASQSEKKRKFLSWLIGGGAVVVVAIVLLAFLKSKPSEQKKQGLKSDTTSINKVESQANPDTLPLTDSLPGETDNQLQDEQPQTDNPTDADEEASQNNGSLLNDASHEVI